MITLTKNVRASSRKHYTKEILKNTKKLDADRPRQGELKNIMTRTRNQYHYVRARKFLEASESGSFELLAEMKKINGNNKDSCVFHECVGGESGEHQLVEEFRKVYSTLYKSDTS